MIYAIRAVGTEFIKFGYSSNRDAADRVYAMQTGCPHELVAVAECQGDRSDEHRILMRLKLAGAHVRGEWFKMCPEAERIIWEIRERSERLPIPPEEAVKPLMPAPTRTGTRLGRAIEYARLNATSTRRQEAQCSQEAAGQPTC